MLLRRMTAALVVLVAIAVLPLTVSASEQPVPEQVVYDFTLADSDLEVNDDGLGGAHLTGGSVIKAFAEFYENGILNWQYFADNTQLLRSETNAVDDVFYFGGTESYKWDGIRLGVRSLRDDIKDYPAGYWMALTIRVPADGAYMLTLDYQTRADGTTAGEVYLLEGTCIDYVDVDRSLDEDVLVGTVDFFKKTWDIEPASVQLGEAELMAGEYTVVFRADQKDGNDVSAYMYLSALRLDSTLLQEQAAQVDALIRAIGTVSSSSGDAITQARQAYSLLGKGAASYVEELDTLIVAEQAYANMGTVDMWTVALAVSVLAAAGIIAAVIIKARKKA